jgi:DUF4097 and DUF4098 domain-containing protein YvlB
MPTFDTPGPIVATVDIGAGHLRINASDRTDTVVDVRPTDEANDADVRAANQCRVELTSGELTVKSPRKKTLRTLIGRPPSIDVIIDLPSDSRVEASVWADVHSQGRLGDSSFETSVGAIRLDQTGRLKVHTAAGDVSVARATGPADVSTSSGKVRIGEVHGSAVLNTSNGEVTLGEVTGDVRMKTAHGDIEVERALAGVDAKTGYGAIRIGEVVRGSVVLKTGFGEVEVGIREGTAAWLDTASGYGHVRTELDAADEPGPSDDTVEIRAHTGFGDIVIRRSARSPAAG